MEIISGAGNRRQQQAKASPATLTIERVIGLSPPSIAKQQTVAHNPCEPEQLAYAAGCFAVVSRVQHQQQSLYSKQQLLRSSTSNRVVCCVCWAITGDYLAVGEAGSGASVLVWRLADSYCLHELKAHKHSIASLSFSHDGKLLVSAGAAHDAQLCIWDWQTGSLLWKQHIGSEINSAAFTEDSSHLLAVGKGLFKAWSVSSSLQQQQPQQQGRSKPASSCTVMLTPRPVTLKEHRGSRFVDVLHAPCLPGQPPGNNGVYALVDTGVLLLMRPTGRCIDKAVDLQVPAAFGLAVAPSLVAVACAQGVVRLFSAKSLAFRATLPRFKGPADAGAAAGDVFPDARGCSFSKGQLEHVVVAYSDQSVIVWDIQDINRITCVASLSAHAGCIWGVCPIRNTSFVSCSQPARCATCASDGTIRIWDLGPTGITEEGAPHKLLAGIIKVGGSGGASPAQAAQVRCMCCSQDCRQLLIGDQLGNLHVYDTVTLKQLLVQEAHDEEVLCLDYSAGSDGTCVAASGSRDGFIHIYDAQHRFQLLETLDDHSAAVTAVRFVGNGKGLVSCGADRSIIFRVLGGNPDGSSAAYHIETLPHSLLYDLALDPLDQYVLTTGQDGLLRQWDVASGALSRTLQPEAGAGEPIRLCIDPGGVVAVCCHSDGCLRLYHLATGQLLWRAWGHGNMVVAATITPDFARVVSVGGDGCIIVWKLPDQLVSEIKAAVARVRTAREQQQHLQAAAAGPLTAAASDPAAPKEAWVATALSPSSAADVDAAAAAFATPTGLACPMSDEVDCGGGIRSALLRIRQGRPLVSTDKLPKWARPPVSPSSTASEDGAGAGTGDTSMGQAPESQWGKWGPQAAAGTSKGQEKQDLLLHIDTGAVPGEISDDGDMCRLSMDSCASVPQDSASQPPPSPPSALAATGKWPTAGSNPQLLEDTSSLASMPQQCWPQAEMVVGQDRDGAEGGAAAAVTVPADDAAVTGAMQAGASNIQQQRQSLVSEQGATPGLVRDLFREHFDTLELGNGLSHPTQCGKDIHAAAQPVHRQSLSSLYKHRTTSISSLEPLSSHVDAYSSSSDLNKPAAGAHHTSSGSQALIVGDSSSDDKSRETVAAAVGEGVAVSQADTLAATRQQPVQPERRWRHGKMDAELQDMRQRLAGLQALYQQQLQQTKLSPRRARDTDDGSQLLPLPAQAAGDGVVVRRNSSSNGGSIKSGASHGRTSSRGNSDSMHQEPSASPQHRETPSFHSPAKVADAAPADVTSPHTNSSSDVMAVAAAAGGVGRNGAVPPLPLGPVPSAALKKLSESQQTDQQVASEEAADAAVDTDAVVSCARVPDHAMDAPAADEAAASPGQAEPDWDDDKARQGGLRGSANAQRCAGAVAIIEHSPGSPSPCDSPSLTAPPRATTSDQHNPWLAELLSADSPASSACPSEGDSEEKTAGLHNTAEGAKAAHQMTADKGVPPHAVVSLQCRGHSSDSDLRVSIGTSIGARDSCCRSSPGPSAAAAPGSAELELSLPADQSLAETDKATPVASADMACATGHVSAAADSHDTPSGSTGHGSPALSDVLPPDQQQPPAAAAAAPAGSDQSSGSKDSSAAAAAAAAASVAAPSAAASSASPLVTSEAAVSQGATITPHGQHLVWPGWGPAGVWDSAMPSPGSTPQLGLPWLGPTAHMPAAAGGDAEQCGSTASSSLAAQEDSAAVAAASTVVSAGSSEAGTSVMGSSVGGAAVCAAASQAAEDGSSMYWISQNPCFDMTPVHSTPGSACHSGKNSTWAQHAVAGVAGSNGDGLYGLAEVTPQGAVLQDQTALLPPQRQQEQQQQEEPSLPQVEQQQHKLDQQEGKHMVTGVLPGVTPGSGSSASPGSPSCLLSQQGDSRKSKSLLKQDKAAAKAAKAAAKGDMGEDDVSVSVSSPGGGMMGLLQRMKKTLPSLKGSSRSHPGCGLDSQSHSEASSPTAAGLPPANLSLGSHGGAASMLGQQPRASLLESNAGAGLAPRPRHSWQQDGTEQDVQQLAGCAGVSAVSELDIHVDFGTSTCMQPEGDRSTGSAANITSTAATAAEIAAPIAAKNTVAPQAVTAAVEVGAINKRHTAADLAASVDRFKKVVQEMQQLWKQLPSLMLSPDDATELQHLLTPPQDARAGACNTGATTSSAAALWPTTGASAGAEAVQHMVTPASCVADATGSAVRPSCASSCSAPDHRQQQQQCDSPVVLVRQRLQDELLHTIWELHATVTGGLPGSSDDGTDREAAVYGGFGPSPLRSASRSTPGSWNGSPLQPRVLQPHSPVWQSTPRAAAGAGSFFSFEFDPGAAAQASPASQAWAQGDMENITARICEQYSQLLLQKLDERKKSKHSSSEKGMATAQ